MTIPQPVAWFARGQRDPTNGTLCLRADDPTGGTLNLQPEQTATPDEPLPEIGCTTDHRGGTCTCTVLDTDPANTDEPITFKCPDCDGETRYQRFSGGREWYCPDCGADGLYPEGTAPRRAQMLADGRFEALRAEMRQALGEDCTALDTEPADELVHDWFGLPDANYDVTPRTLLQSMPLEWQQRWVQLMGELSDAFAHTAQAPGYQVTPCEWRSPDDVDDETLTALGYSIFVDSDGARTYCTPNTEIVEGWQECVPVPVRDPIPHYDHGRARVEPRIEASQ